MSTHVTAIVPAALREAAEAEIEPLLVSPTDEGHYLFSVPLVPYPGPADAEVTAYGCNSPSGPATVAALPILLEKIAGSHAHTVHPRAYSRQRDWVEWLWSLGYQEKETTVD